MRDGTSQKDRGLQQVDRVACVYAFGCESFVCPSESIASFGMKRATRRYPVFSAESMSDVQHAQQRIMYSVSVKKEEGPWVVGKSVSFWAVHIHSLGEVSRLKSLC